MVKTIKLEEETHKRLNSLGLRNETFNDIVKRLIDFYKNGGKNKK